MRVHVAFLLGLRPSALQMAACTNDCLVIFELTGGALSVSARTSATLVPPLDAELLAATGDLATLFTAGPDRRLRLFSQKDVRSGATEEGATGRWQTGCGEKKRWQKGHGAAEWW